MDPSHRGLYRPATNQDDGEVRLVVDIFDQMPPNYNNTVYRSDVAGAPAIRRPEIDLNNPAKQEEDSPFHSPVVDTLLQHAPVDDDYTGSNYGSCNYGNSSGGGYVDWARGSIDVGPDGKLACYENAHPSTPVRSPGESGFDLNAAVKEAQERDEAYYEERLENLRKGQMEDQFLEMSFRDSSPADDPDYDKLWND